MLRSLTDWLADQATSLAAPLARRAQHTIRQLITDAVVSVHAGGCPR